MLDNQELEINIRELIIEICEVLYHRGYQAVPVGGMMRLLGVNNSQAQSHDDEYFMLDEDFQKLMDKRQSSSAPPVPRGTTLH